MQESISKKLDKYFEFNQYEYAYRCKHGVRRLGIEEVPPTPIQTRHYMSPLSNTKRVITRNNPLDIDVQEEERKERNININRQKRNPTNSPFLNY